MRKSVPLFMALVLVASVTSTAFAGGHSAVQYTFTFTDLGQPGAHGGGPLYADGSAGGNMTLSALDGQVIVELDVTHWSEIVPCALIDLCFETHVIKGPAILPASFCFSQLGLALPVNGTPVRISNPFADQALVRVTAVN
jgi:hypothetical protein